MQGFTIAAGGARPRCVVRSGFDGSVLERFWGKLRDNRRLDRDIARVGQRPVVLARRMELGNSDRGVDSNLGGRWQ